MTFRLRQGPASIRTAVRRITWPHRHVWAAITCTNDGILSGGPTTLWATQPAAMAAAHRQQASEERRVRKVRAKRVAEQAFEDQFERDYARQENVA